MPSNRGLADHLAVSPISDSNELMAGFSATSESNDLMTGSFRSCTAALLATSKSRFCVMRVPYRPKASMYWPIRCLASARSSLLRLMLSRSMYHGALKGAAAKISAISRATGSVVFFELSWTSRLLAAASSWWRRTASACHGRCTRSASQPCAPWTPRRAEPGPLPHRPRGDLLRLHNAQVELRLFALVSNVVRPHIHGVADDDLAFNPGHAISCAPDLFPSDPAVCTTGRGKGPRPTPPRHTRARTGTGVQGRAIAGSTPISCIQRPNQRLRSGSI